MEYEAVETTNRNGNVRSRERLVAPGKRLRW